MKKLSVKMGQLQLAERVEEHVSTEHANWFNEARRVGTSTKQERKECL